MYAEASNGVNTDFLEMRQKFVIMANCAGYRSEDLQNSHAGTRRPVDDFENNKSYTTAQASCGSVCGFIKLSFSKRS